MFTGLYPTSPTVLKSNYRDKFSLLEELFMSELQVGMEVADFELTTFEPEKSDFGKISLAGQKEKGRWTCLFFYPADFTFV